MTWRGGNYTVAGITEAANFISSNEDVIIVDDTKNKSGNNIIAFLDYEHNRNKVKDAVMELDNNDISYINQYEGSTTIQDEFVNLKKILYILSVAVFVICCILVSTSFLLSLKTENEYWTNMRMLGLTIKKLKGNIIALNMIFSTVGSLVGVCFSVFVGMLICKLTDTSFQYAAINWGTLAVVTIIGILVVILPILLILVRITKNEPMKPFVTSKHYKRKKNHSKIILLFLIAFLFLIATWQSKRWLNYFVKSDMTYYGTKLVLSFLALLFLTIVIIDSMTIITRRTHYQSIRLLSYTIKNQTQRIKGVTISLAVSVVILGTLVDFSSSFKAWASELANQQLTFDARATTKNDDLGLKELETLTEQENIEAQGSYYLDVGKLSNLSVYVMAELPQSNMLNRIYNSITEFNKLEEHQIVLTKQLLKTLNLKVGDKVKVSLNGNIKEVEIIDSFATQDYSSYIVVLSNRLFEADDYKKLCVNFSLLGNVTLDKIKLSKEYASIKFESQNQLVSQWEESIVSGVDILIYVCGIIAIALLLMLNNMIKNSVLDRKHELSLYRCMGLGKNAMLRLLYKELIYALYDVVCQSEHLVHILILVIIMVLLLVSPIRLFHKVKNESPIDSLKQL